MRRNVSMKRALAALTKEYRAQTKHHDEQVAFWYNRNKEHVQDNAALAARVDRMAEELRRVMRFVSAKEARAIKAVLDTP